MLEFKLGCYSLPSASSAASRLWGAQTPNLYKWCAMYSCSIWSSPRALVWFDKSGWGSTRSFWVLWSSVWSLEFFWKSCHLWHVSRSLRALSSNPWFGVKGPGDNIVSSTIFLSPSVLQRIFWKGGSVVYCLPVGSRGEYCSRFCFAREPLCFLDDMGWAVALLLLLFKRGLLSLDLHSCRYSHGFQVEFFNRKYSTSWWGYSIRPCRC